MSEVFTKTMARNIFYGGSVFFFLLLLALTFDTQGVLAERDHRENITPEVVLGKKIWEDNDCIGCHTLLGEGAYFAPELGNVYKRRGNSNPAAFKIFMSSWMKYRQAANDDLTQKGDHRRRMPQFDLTDEEINALSEFFIWTANVNTANWPPNIEG